MRLTATIRSVADKFAGSRLACSNVLVVSGFWRSGTTWVMRMAGEMLGARTVFEPLSPKSGAMTRLGDTQATLPYGRAEREIYMPGITVDGDLDPWAALVLTQAVRGAYSDEWTQRERRGFANLFSGTLVLKEVRLSLCLPWLPRNLRGCGVVHLMRDPRSVIAGILRRPGWAAGAFENIDLESQLLRRQVSYNELDPTFRNRLAEYGSGSAIERLTAFWSATQLVALNQIDRLGGRCRVIRYEDLVRRGEVEFRAMLIAMEYPVNPGVSVQHGPTSTTDTQRANIDVDERLKSWRETLSGKQVASIEKVIERLGMRAWVYE